MSPAPATPAAGKPEAPGGTHYFAYGSNLSSEQMRERVSSARAAGTARLDGYRLSCGKRGRDGTGKANLVAEAGVCVWGVLYTLDVAHWPVLDTFERGYERVSLSVTTLAGARVTATAYAAPETADPPVPLASYKRIIVAGALEHGLPPEYVELLKRLPELPNALPRA